MLMAELDISPCGWIKNKHTQAMATPAEKLAIARAPWSLVSSFAAIFFVFMI